MKKVKKKHKNGWNYHHFNSIDRGKIKGWLDEKVSKREIARRIRCSDTAIRKEIKRGTFELPSNDVSKPTQYGYLPDAAQWWYERKKKAKRQLKCEKKPEILQVIVSTLDEQRRINKPWSLNAANGRINAFPNEFNIHDTICTKTLYNYLHTKRVETITNRYRFYSMNKRKHEKRPTKRQNGMSIELRPICVNKRERFGDWEIDTIKSRRGDNACLLNMLERKTRFARLRKMSHCSSTNIVRVLDQLEKNQEIITGGTCTGDNGCEFTNVKRMEKSKNGQKRLTMFYTHSYCAWEKGSVEQSNGIFRVVIPKGTEIGKLTEKEVQDIEDWQNDYPRQQFGYKTAREKYNECMQKVVSKQAIGVRTF